MTFKPQLERLLEGGELVSITLGHPLLDEHLEFVAARGARNTWLATAYDLKVFFEVVGRTPNEVSAADVFAFLAAQRAPRRGEKVVRIEDGEAGLAARTIARRLSSVAGLFEYLLARGDAGVVSNPVPRGLASRPPGRRVGAGCGWCARRGRCRGCSRRRRSTRCSARCAPTAIGRWCWRCCWVLCAAARCSACSSVT
jgi:integrase/recombinase XerD